MRNLFSISISAVRALTVSVGYFLAAISFSNAAFSFEQTYIREYTYQASEADSKISARAIALQEVKCELLSELGTHVSALVKLQSSSDGRKLGTEEIETLSAGVTSIQILDEKWNGVIYVLKAQIKADPSEVLISLNKMLDADKKQKQISLLGGELARINGEKILISESLIKSKQEATAALAEIVRLKKQLEEKRSESSRKNLHVAYQQQIDELSMSDWIDSAFKNYGEGNYSETIRLLRKAAEQGSAIAQFSLGLIYSDGIGISSNANQAMYWYQKSADQGYAAAQYNLGVMYDSSTAAVHDKKRQCIGIKNLPTKDTRMLNTILE
jgi:hypothetical protein